MKEILLMMVTMLVFPSCKKIDSSIKVEPPTSMSTNIQMIVGNTTFTVSLYGNSTVEKFLTMLPITMSMSDLNNNEKYYDLPNSLPSNTIKPGTILNGDIMLYGSRTLVIFYETFSTSYSYTKIGRVNDALGLKTALGKNNVIVKFEQIP